MISSLDSSSSPQPSTRGPTQPGTVTANYYTPTLEEKRVIDHANGGFVWNYLLGISAGVAAGFSIVRYRKVRWNSMPGISLLAATTLTGEIVGRKLGEGQARTVLANELPSDSQLRRLLEQNAQGKGLSIPSRGGDGTGEKHDYGLEGAVMSSDMSPVAAPASTSSDMVVDDDNGEGINTSSTSWEAIRRQGTGSQSAWDRLRNPSRSSPTDAPTDAPTDPFPSPAPTTTTPAPTSIPRTHADLLEKERLGHLRRTPYGDLDTPAIQPVGGRGMLGPYGDTVAATPAGMANIPRTREELEEVVGSGRVKRNRWGDLVAE
ncbi:uncharacterized protein EV422DRAFT_252898 [Fimicolochytrium jonesii]|uniref:uncharacterized protein n=1 Tax=Fimicolochytrium jonesii TaxID=1396493 RepID=UPI0022FEE99F|nr:uncharacterized protein EV422DRAFT_252898 [Fimicolochytrium jonesii]KAI8825271.1 hypothetical protein EV422DRAFT_252898 [Fimicolochytrium jonesii]